MIKIFVSTFDKKIMRVKYGIPLEVGAANRNKFIYDLHDDTDDNISIENPYFGELTGLYWVWKNYPFSIGDYVGFCHYNKSLNLKKNHFKMIENTPDLWITSTPFINRNHPIQKELDELLLILEKDYPHYCKIWIAFYNQDGSGKGKVCMGANIFLTSYKEFCEYCAFLFDVLFKLRERVGEGSNNPNMRRYCAFMAERLLSVYIEANQKKVISVDIRNKQWYLTAVKSIASILHISKQSRIYRVLKNKFGYKSSYGRK